MKSNRAALFSLGLAMTSLGLLAILDSLVSLGQLALYFVLFASLWVGTHIRGWQRAAFVGTPVLLNPITPEALGKLWPEVAGASTAVFCGLAYCIAPVPVTLRFRGAVLWWFSPFRDYPAETEGMIRSAEVLSRVYELEAAALRKVGAKSQKAEAHAKVCDTALTFLFVEHVIWEFAWWGLRMGLTLSAVAAVRLALEIRPF